MTLKFDGWHWKPIEHLFFTTLSFVHHFKTIGEFKLELRSGNIQFRSKSAIFLSHVTLKFVGITWKTIGHLFYATLSFVHHFKAIGKCTETAWPIVGQETVEHDQKLINPGEFHNDCIHLVWDQSPGRVVRKCAENAWPIKRPENGQNSADKPIPIVPQTPLGRTDLRLQPHLPEANE